MHTPEPAVTVVQRAGAIVLAAALLAVAPVWAEQAPEIPRFSAAQAGGLPPGWQHNQLASFKADTEYKLVAEEGAVVLRAAARSAASYLGFHTTFDPHRFPALSWRWKIVQGIPDADTNDRRKEDAPARVMVSFDGDPSKLSLKDRAAASAARTISGQALPYAELMYIWGGKVAVDSITTSTHSSRIKMIAVATDEAGVGRWHSYTRNLVEDYKRAFGEEPGNVTAIEIMTDTDNTGGSAEALYGDITVQPRP
jgi:hypothetical protein